jgi:hypothetical protein
MDEVKNIQKKYSSQAMLMAICVAFIFILIGHKAIGKGFLLASIFSVINFVLMAQFSPLKLGKTRVKASSMALFSIILRYAILSVPLIISIKMSSLNFFAAVAGLFTIQLVMVLDQVILKRFPLIRKVKQGS